METPIYTQTGNQLAIAGVVAMILTKFGIPTDAQAIVSVIGGFLALVGIYKQWMAHKKLAVVAGALRPRN